MRDRHYRIVCVVLAAVALLVVRFPRFAGRGSAGIDELIQQQKEKVVPVRPQIRRDVMIEFPILLLGGFRGPLVMGLWIRAEEEKNQQQWWNVKTYHEIIAHLQPNFPSVYVFNAWNLAYNLSVQWHELENKYLWVQDGARYAQKGLWINPDSPDIMFQLADICGQKLGSAMPERLYYRQRFSADTARVAKIVEKLPVQERKDLANSKSLKERDKTALLVRERQGQLEMVPIDLKKYPYGVSPFYLAYEYEKRTRQMGPHSIFGESPMHARPPVTLMRWARSEMLTAIGWAGQMVSGSGLSKAERDNLILPIPIEPSNPEPGSERWNELKEIVRFHFEESQLRFSEAIEGFKEHLEKYPKDEGTHRKHIYICTYQGAISRGRKNLFLGLCSILENEGKIAIGSAGYQYLRAAVNDFRAAIGVRQEDGSYPRGSLLGYQQEYYPWPEAGKMDIKKQDRDELEELKNELSWKIGQIARLGTAIAEGQAVKVDLSVLRLHATEEYF